MPIEGQIVGRQGQNRFAIRTRDDKGVVVDLEEGEAIRPGMHWQTLFKSYSYWDAPGEIESVLREKVLQLAGCLPASEASACGRVETAQPSQPTALFSDAGEGSRAGDGSKWGLSLVTVSGMFCGHCGDSHE